MPELSLRDLRDLQDPECGAYLFAVMLKPRDPSAHSEFVDSFRNQAVLNLLSKMGQRPRPLPPSMNPVIAAASGGPRMGEIARRYAIMDRNGRVRGETAARLLIYQLSCVQHDPKNASFERVCRDLYGTWHSRAGYSRSQLADIWGEYRPAAHLWAAMMLEREAWYAGRLALVLQIAEALRHDAEGFTPPKAKTPIFPTGEAWRAPERLGIPRCPLAFPDPAAILSEIE